MPICSSIEDENGEDGEELDSQTSEAHKSQKENQMAVLGDIRFLFSKNQDIPVNTIQVSNYNSKLYLYSR